MIIQKDFLNKLKDFGLNSYEAKLWTALLSRGVATAGELSDIANVPRSRSYDVLESLERKGFVVMKLGKPIKYIAVPPGEVIERVKKKIKEEAKKQSQVIDGLKNGEVLDDLNVLFKQGVDIVDPAELTGVLKGRTNLYNHLNFLIKNAEKSVSIATTQSGFLRKQEALKSAIQKAHDKGVRIRILTQSKPKTNTLGKVAQIKQNNTIPNRFCVVDSEKVVFMVLDDMKTHPNYDFAVWVSVKDFAKSFENFFNTLWNRK